MNIQFLARVRPLLAVVLICGAPVRAAATDGTPPSGSAAEGEVVKNITKSLEVACNNRDVMGFLRHYTPQRAAKVRRAVEDMFVCHDMELTVHEAFVLSAGEEEIVFGVRYAWHGKADAEQVIASRVTARKLGESWLLDSEEILSRKSPSTAYAKVPGAVAQPPAGGTAGGGRPDWVPRDIGWRPGGCSGGRCGL